MRKTIGAIRLSSGTAEQKQYWMLIAARLKVGPRRRRGCTALAVSTDLQHWQVRDPFWAPGLFFTHECPDLFRIGDWWYLLFSEFSKNKSDTLQNEPQSERTLGRCS